jgi:dipeptidyl aminopeptidase/acylaminoacyl peptidase
MVHLRRAVLLVLCVCSLVAFAEKRPITEKDLFKFTWIADPQLSPDGSQVAFVRVTVADKKDEYDTAIWIVPTKGGDPRPLTSGPRDTSPQWSPDGTRLAFVRSVEKDGKRQPPQIYLLYMAGGEASQVTKLAKGASRPTWSPDGKLIAFNSTTTPEDIAKEQCKGGAARDGGGTAGEDAGATKSKCVTPDHESDVHVISRAVYRANGAGYLDPTHPNHIWVIASSSGDAEKPRQLTSGTFAESDIEWAPDGSRIYFTSNHVLEAYYELPKNIVYEISPQGGEAREVTHIDGAASRLSVSPDGKRLAFIGSLNQPVKSYTKPDLWVADLGGGAPTKLTGSFDADIGSGVGGDNSPPRASGGSKPTWTKDGGAIIVNVAKEGRENLWRIDANSGQAAELTKGAQAVEGFNTNDNVSDFVLLISMPTNIGDLFLQSANGGEPRRLTNINDKLFSTLNLTAPEELWYTSFDGKKIHAWIQKPPDFDKSKKYPLILNIHGGPHAAYGWVFDHEFQYMAAKGYVVLYPNPRGSTSYGQEFGNIIQYHYPGDDFKDLMAGVDEVLKRGYIDEKRMGVTGGSGGGLLTDWVVGHTDRFAAAVAQRDIASWAAWWYSADFTLFQPSWFRKAPFEDPQDFTERSPITYIKNVKTPMMFILGDADWRTPEASGGEEMFRALKYRKIPTVMVRFPGESHELSRSGQPWHRIERLEHITNWFDIYLRGIKIAGYAPGEEGAWK